MNSNHTKQLNQFVLTFHLWQVFSECRATLTRWTTWRSNVTSCGVVSRLWARRSRIWRRIFTTRICPRRCSSCGTGSCMSRSFPMSSMRSVSGIVIGLISVLTSFKGCRLLIDLCSRILLGLFTLFLVNYFFEYLRFFAKWHVLFSIRPLFFLFESKSLYIYKIW